MSLPGITKPKAQKIDMFNIDFSKKGEIALTKENTLRKTVGIVGMLLPVLIFLFLWIDTGHGSVLPSISHYYYTRSSGIFVIIVSLLAIFLLIYKGDMPAEFYLSAAAGVFALFVVLFPAENLSGLTCSNCDNNTGAFEKKYVVSVLKDSEFRRNLHNVSAGIFLGCLAIMSFWLFTKSVKPFDEAARKRQEKRHFIYKSCAIAMFAALSVILFHFLFKSNWPFYEKHNLTFWMEVIALEAFGISWLTKGKAFIKE